MGAVFAGIGHTTLVFAEGFRGLVLFEIALGISSSLISGSDIALIYDSEAALGRGEAQQGQVIGRLFSARTFSGALAAVGWIPLLLVLAAARAQRAVAGAV